MPDGCERSWTDAVPVPSFRRYPTGSGRPSTTGTCYRWRHLIENDFAKIKEFRGIATRYDKTDTSYAANWNLVATVIAAR